MVNNFEKAGKKIFACGICGFGYTEKSTAEECENWCSKNTSCNLMITKKAVYIPKS